jgi:hypothetical protein
MLTEPVKKEIWLFTSILAASQTLFLQQLTDGQKLKITQKILNRIILEHRLTISDRSEANNIIKNAIEEYDSKVPKVFQQENYYIDN